MAERTVKLDEFGLQGEVVLQSVPWGAYKAFQKECKVDPESTDPSNRMLLRAIKSAPFKFEKIEDFDELPGELVLSLTIEMEEMLRPLLEKAQKRRSSGSAKPTEADGRTTPS